MLSRAAANRKFANKRVTMYAERLECTDEERQVVVEEGCRCVER